MTMNTSFSFVDEVRRSPYYNAFDPYEDFCQFMDEAQQHAQEAGSQLLEPEKEKLAANKKQVKDNNSKKSWKASGVLSWLRGGKLRAKQSSNLGFPEQESVSFSGPVCGSDRNNYAKPKRQLSGPLKNLFTPLKRVGTTMQYTSLQKPKSDNSGAYGPITYVYC